MNGIYSIFFPKNLYVQFFPYNSKTNAGRQILIADLDSTPKTTLIKTIKTFFLGCHQK